MPKALSVSVRHITIRRSTKFKQLPVYLSALDLSAWLNISRTDAEALVNGSPYKTIDGVPRISKYRLQSPFYSDLIKTMRRHPSGPSIQRIVRAEVEKILSDKSHPQHRAFKKEFLKYQGGAK